METQNNAAKYAFFYMLSLVALIFMALSAGMIIFQIINKNIVDIINQYQGRYAPELLKFAISALIISAPIYYIAVRQIFKNLASGALKKDSGIRKWLTYLILFISSVVMLGWLIGTVNSFLDGDLTIKFILKSITAIGIAAAVFTFYFYDIRREEVDNKKNNLIRIYLFGSLALVIAIFAASLFFVESPTQTRNRKIDNAILEDFNVIDGAITTYYDENGQMPTDFAVLREDFSYLKDDDFKNPVNEDGYEYKIIGENKYELCTAFMSSNKDDSANQNDYYQDRWPHEAGYQCLGQTVHNTEEAKIRKQAEIPVD